MKPIICLTAFFFFIHTVIAQAPSPTGDINENFDSDSLVQFRYGSTGVRSATKWRSGLKSPTEKKTSILSFKIDPADSAGAGRGPEIISLHPTHFGSYSTRLKVPDVKKTQPNVGAVVGYFTYHMDSIQGLSEIDFEWLIADPTVIYIGTWTGQRGKLERIGRTINLAKGIIYNTAYRINHTGTDSVLSGEQNKPETIEAIPDYDASKRFYTYGFDWQSDRIRWWIEHPATKEKITLWEYSGSKVGIPQHASLYRMNFWHTNNWSVHTNPLSLEKPLQQYELEVDWMRYKK